MNKTILSEVLRTESEYMMRRFKTFLNAAIILGVGVTTVFCEELTPEMQKLTVFVGDWTYEGQQDASPADLPFGGAGTFSGTITNHFILSGSFLESQMEDKNPAGTTKLVEITGYSAAANSYLVNAYVSGGSRDAAVLTVLPDGKTWTSKKRFTTKTGKEVLLKSVRTFTSDWRSYTATEDFSVDGGKTWTHWYTYVAKKVIQASEQGPDTAANNTPSVTRRPGESEAAYQARIRVARAAAQRQVASTAQQESPLVTRRPGEREAVYQARVRAARAAARRKETSSTQKELPSLVTRRPGESEAAYQARIRAARARVSRMPSKSGAFVIPNRSTLQGSIAQTVKDFGIKIEKQGNEDGHPVLLGTSLSGHKVKIETLDFKPGTKAVRVTVQGEEHVGALLWEHLVTSLKERIPGAETAVRESQIKNNIVRSQKQADIEARNLATFHRYWKELVNDGDFSNHHDLVSPKFTAHLSGKQAGLSGVALIKRAKEQRDQPFSSIELVADEVTVKHNTVAVRFHVVAVHDRGRILDHAPNGKEITWRGMAFYRFDEKGLIAGAHIVTNLIGVLEAETSAVKRSNLQFAASSRQSHEEKPIQRMQEVNK